MDKKQIDDIITKLQNVILEVDIPSCTSDNIGYKIAAVSFALDRRWRRRNPERRIFKTLFPNEAYLR